MDNHLAVFQGKNIRRTWYNDEWWFSVVDILEVLTESTNPRNYWNMLKSRELDNGVELSTFCVQLKLMSSNGKLYLTDSVNPTDYIKKLRKRDEELGLYLGTNCPHVEMLAETGK